MPITFSRPVRFEELSELRQVQTILPTTLSSDELSRISSDILKRALFSARTASAEYLQSVGDVLDRYIGGELDLATARLILEQKVAELGLDATSERINLVLRMNSQSAAGYGYWSKTQEHLVQWPCQELVRVGFRRTHRQWSGLDEGEIIKNEPVIGRWREHGGELYEDRMVALVNDPIWTSINRFGVPYPPFDFNSGMGVEGVNRKEAIRLGVISPNLAPQEPLDRDFNDDLEFTTSIRQQALREVLESIGYHFRGDILTP